MPDSKFQSLIGDSATQERLDGQEGWSTQQAARTDNKMQVWQKKNGVEAFTTYSQYQASQTQNNDETGIVPPWHALDLTAFLAKDVQTAINQIKDIADKIIAYAQLTANVAKAIGQIVASTVGLIEAAINLLRDEIKQALDQLMGLGGAYVLFIPPDWNNRGGIDYFKKTFYDSLQDTQDLRRPQIDASTAAHALFLVAGAPDITQEWQGFEDLKKLIGGFGAGQSSAAGVSQIPGPDQFQVKPIYGPVWKWPPLKQDMLYKYAEQTGQSTAGANTANAGGANPVTQGVSSGFGAANSGLRMVEGYATFSEKAAALQAYCSWKVPTSYDLLSLGSIKTDTFFGFYSNTQYYQPSTNNLQATDYVFSREDVVLTHWVIVRSNDPEVLKKVNSGHPAILKLLQEDGNELVGTKQPTQLTLGGANFNNLDAASPLTSNDLILIGRLIPTLNFVSDTGLPDPKDDKQILQASIDPKTADPTTRYKNTKNFYYKIAFIGKKRSLKKLYRRQSPDSTTYDVFLSKNSTKFSGAPLVTGEAISAANPFGAKPDDTVDIPDIKKIKASDLSYGKCDPIYEGYNIIKDAGAEDRFVFSDWSHDAAVTNETLKVPGGGVPPDWIAVKGIELLPPLAKFVEEAKQFIDSVADALIEGLNILNAFVQAIVDEIADLTTKLINLMNALKQMLFPPMAGVHYLAISSKRGVSGLKGLFDRSFSVAPQSTTGEKDYPDEFIKYGARVSKGSSTVDIPGQQTGAQMTNDPANTQDPGLLNHYLDSFKNGFNRVTDSRGRRNNEPSDAQLRAMGIPVYDVNHYTMGMVIVFETVTMLNAFIRLLNFEQFAENIGAQLRNNLVGLKNFNSVNFPVLKLPVLPNREHILAERLSAITQAAAQNGGTLPPATSPTAAQGAAQASKTGASDSLGTESNLDAYGNQHLTSLGTEPFCMPVPTVLTYVCSGIPVNVQLSATNPPTIPCYSAATIAAKTNSAFALAVAQSLGFTSLTELTPSGVTVDVYLAKLGLGNLCDFADGKIIINSPPAFLGDGSRTVYTNDAIFGTTTVRGRNFADELSTQGAAFPVANGDFIIEVEKFGTPTFAMQSSVPAIYEYNDFVSDPVAQDFSPTRCHLILNVDGLPQQRVDVTGNLGENTQDAGAALVLPGTPSQMVFPLSIDYTNNRFKVAIFGSFTRLANFSGVDVSGLYNQVTKPGVDWTQFGLKIGDSITLQAPGEDPFTSTISVIAAGALTLTHLIPFDVTQHDGTIVSVLAGGLPPELNPAAPNGTPAFSAEIVLAPVDLDLSNPTAVKTYANLNQLMQDVTSALQTTGLSPGTLQASVTDTSGGFLTSGTLTLQLAGVWADTPLVSLTVSSPAHTGAGAILTTPPLPVGSFPLTLTGASSQFQFEIFGAGANAPVGYRTISLAPALYAGLPELVSAVQAGLSAAGFSMVSVSGVGAALQFTIKTTDPVTSQPALTHWAFSSKVGMHLKGLVPLDKTPPQTSQTPVTQFIDGVPLPPVVKLVPNLTYPLTVAPGYADALSVMVSPVIKSRPSGAQTVTLSPGTYTSLFDIQTGMISALSRVGFASGSASSGWLRADIANGGLLLSLDPEPSYETSSASLLVANTRSSAPSLTGALYQTVELRDYDFSGIKAWYAANPQKSAAPYTTYPTQPAVAPRIFLADQYGATGGVGSVYSGSWTVSVGVNDSFQVQFMTPVPGIPSGWKTVTIPPGSYGLDGSSHPVALVTALQTAFDSVYSAGTITVSFLEVTASEGDGTPSYELTFQITHPQASGSFSSLQFQQYNSQSFFCFGGRSALFASLQTAGAGTRTFMEVAQLADQTVLGQDDFVTKIALVSGSSLSDGQGLKYLEATGVNDYNFLRVIKSPGVSFSGVGTSKTPYTLDQIITAINAHFGALDPTYAAISEDYAGFGRLRLTGKILGVNGLLSLITNPSDPTAGAQESAEVAQLLFGYPVLENTNISVSGLGQAPTCNLLETYLSPGSLSTWETNLFGVASYASETLAPSLLVELLSQPTDGYLSDAYTE